MEKRLGSVGIVAEAVKGKKRNTLEKQLQNLARGRAIRQRNLQMQQRRPVRNQRVPQRRIQPQRRQRTIIVPRNAQIINPRFLINRDLDNISGNRDLNVTNMNKNLDRNDLDVSRVDNSFNESVRARGESLFANLDDVVPQAIQRRNNEL